MAETCGCISLILFLGSLHGQNAMIWSSDTIPLPKTWAERIKSSILHVISLARLAIIHTRGWAVDSSNDRVRLQAELDGARNEVSLLKEEIRI